MNVNVQNNIAKNQQVSISSDEKRAKLNALIEKEREIVAQANMENKVSWKHENL